MTKKKKNMGYLLEQHLNQLRNRWLAYANEAERYKLLYEEGNLFINRAFQRLPEDSPLHPANYAGMISEDYLQELAAAFEEQDAESSFDPELDKFVGVDEVPIMDEIEKLPSVTMEEGFPGTEGELFNVSDYNKQVIADAEKANEEEENEETNDIG